MPLKNEKLNKLYQKKYHAEWYKKNKEKRNSQIAEYAKNQPEEWRKNIGRKYHLKTRYNLTPKEYQDKLKSQNYKCAICNKDITENIRGGKAIALSIDHDHDTNKIRSLLCYHCNSGLGQFMDKSDLLIKASEYLKKYNK